MYSIFFKGDKQSGKIHYTFSCTTFYEPLGISRDYNVHSIVSDCKEDTEALHLLIRVCSYTKTKTNNTQPPHIRSTRRTKQVFSCEVGDNSFNVSTKLLFLTKTTFSLLITINTYITK